MYMIIPGKDLGRMAAELTTVVSANAQLAQYHTDRRTQLSTE
jgi:hypothetical protein